MPHQRAETKKLRREATNKEYDQNPILRTTIHEVGQFCWKVKTLGL